MNRRTFLKKSVGTLLAAAGLGGGTYYYAREIEPGMLAIHHEQIVSSKIPDAFHNFKIVQFSDTHIGYQYSLEQFTNLVKAINDQDPDIIVFTGDLVDEPHTYHWNNELIEALKSLQANFGKYWIYGNHDHGGYGTDIVKRVMDKADFRLLKNNHAAIEIDNEKIIMSGIDDLILGRPDLESTLSAADSNLFTLLLAHEPDFADTAVHYPVDVQLSGHSPWRTSAVPIYWGFVYTIICQKICIGETYIKQWKADIICEQRRGNNPSAIPVLVQTGNQYVFVGVTENIVLNIPARRLINSLVIRSIRQPERYTLTTV